MLKRLYLKRYRLLKLSDAIEAAALTSRIDNKAVPAFPVTADLDYIYTHLEKLQNK